MERDFKKALLEDFGIHFHNLFTITNLPISRFLDYLLASDNYEDYMYNLVDAYNPLAVEKVSTLPAMFQFTSHGYSIGVYRDPSADVIKMKCDFCTR